MSRLVSPLFESVIRTGRLVPRNSIASDLNVYRDFPFSFMTIGS